MVNIGENILESLETNLMNLSPYVFDEDYVAKIRSWLFIPFLKRKTQIIAEKIVTLVDSVAIVTILMLSFQAIGKEMIMSIKNMAK